MKEHEKGDMRMKSMSSKREEEERKDAVWSKWRGGLISICPGWDQSGRGGWSSTISMVCQRAGIYVMKEEAC